MSCCPETFQVIGSSVSRKLRKAPLIVRRFGLIQTCQLLLSELVRGTRISRSLGRPLARYTGRFRMRDSTVLLLRPIQWIWEYFTRSGITNGIQQAPLAWLPVMERSWILAPT